MRVTSTDLNFTVALALISVVMTQVIGVQSLGPGYFSKFLAFGNFGRMWIKERLGPFEVIMPFIDIFVGILETVAEIAKIMQQIKEYQRRVEITPTREEELLSLKRDYDNINESYNSLLERKLEADIAVNLEKKQKGEQFRIVDHARLPQKPVSPDLKKLIMLAVAAGLGIGGGLIFLRDYLDTSLKRPDDIEAELGVPVLATIPRLYQAKGRMFKQVNWVLTGIGVLIGIILLGVFGLLALNGVNPTIELAQQYTNFPIQKVISKISL